jgi:sulfoxide reductase heme-binding subunit YedZ
VFVAIHVLSLLADSYSQLRLVDLIVPFRGAYRPLWLGFGTVAIDLLIAIMITSLLRRRVGLRVFRVVHWLTYALWPVALIHSIGTGTDAGQPLFIACAVFCSMAVIAAVGWRLTRGFVEYRAVRDESALDQPIRAGRGE